MRTTEHRPRRRSRLLVAVAAACLLVLTGCSSGGEGDAVGETTVTHAFGDTVVPANPQRVVSVGLTEQDTLLALGIVPVGVTEWYGDQPYATWPWARDLLGDATPEVLSQVDGIQFEKVSALEPDLIIGTNAGMSADDYARLSAIAPTIAHSDPDLPYFEPWDQQVRTIGAAVGKPDEADALVRGVQDRYRDAAAQHPEFADTKAVFLQNAFYDGNAIAYQDGLSTDFLTSLGFTIPDELDSFVTAQDAQAYIPLENLSVLDAADVLIWGTEDTDDRTALEADPVYASLQEVRENRVVFTDGVVAGAIYFTSPLSLPYLLDALVPALSSTLAGDGPATAAGPA
ncbi:iron complex transport system substrate-binding protein [Rhodococcoides kroppenstedtii]|uniref:Iron complex transport system substrate-binding protein n=1 Tax=Rhodococcoides kroppenstedtii TaxID=293050 RepID=A0A1I0SIJ8_9NOCA|nr:ABC transporter substrate-binding protein [Rhodococcus kroppenstedtii]SFA39319.1 iron complex transport system substrate-binding protein [Rhodococcus kroppenstedtii]